MFITCLAMCVYVEIYKLCWKKGVIIFIELARVVYVSRFRNVTLFTVRERIVSADAP